MKYIFAFAVVAVSLQVIAGLAKDVTLGLASGIGEWFDPPPYPWE